jgi:hypothetical protein
MSADCAGAMVWPRNDALPVIQAAAKTADAADAGAGHAARLRWSAFTRVIARRRR